MSEQINKVLADRAQSFSTSEQAQARYNIGAMAASASSEFAPASAGFSGVSANNGITGSGTTSSPIGLSSKVKFENSLSSTIIGPNQLDIHNHVGTSYLGGAFMTMNVNYNGGATSYMNVSSLKFTNSANVSEQVDLSSIQRWNGYSSNSGSLVQIQNYGGTAEAVSALLIDGDDPEGYCQVKADGTATGYLVAGPYLGTLNSCINGGAGVGDSATPVYFDTDGHAQACDPIPKYTEGTGISINTANQISWKYTVGRNLWLNQNDAIQTNIPGGQLDPTDYNWQVVGDFAGSFKLLARANTDGTYDVGLRYTASGMSSSFTLVGKQILADSGNTLTITKCNYFNSSVTYSGDRIGAHFNPSNYESMIIEGLAIIGSLYDFRVALWKDGNGTVHVAFTAIEVGKVGATN